MTDPIARFEQWLKEAKADARQGDPTAMILATAAAGIPSARAVLLKHVDAHGFVFYTNLESRKSRELKENPHAALCFNWMALGRQVRVEGKAGRVSDDEADAYFNSRTLESRLSAMASEQSRPIANRSELEARVKTLKRQYSAGNPPPRPAFWSGWRITPRVIEFWQQGEHRLHDREVFTHTGDGWTSQRLQP